MELRRRIRGVRLLSLIGAPGAGKSQLAADLLEAERHTSHRRVAELDLADPLNTLTPWPAFFWILDQLREAEESTLLLDNCDRALEPWGPLVLDLLARLPSLRIITTSREAWRLPGEAVYRVMGLSYGAPTSAQPGHPVESDASRLFADRAEAASPAFQITAENTSDIAWICDWCEGLPLAIELAAQATAARSTADIRSELAKGMATLDRPGPSPDPRHASWDAAVRWTYDTLARPERDLLRWLSVLPSGFDRNAAVAVCPPDSPVATLVPRLLVSLEAKSLLRAELQGPEGSTRFAIPELIRGFALRHLTATEHSQVLNRLAAWLKLAADRLSDDAVPTLALRRSLALRRPVARTVLTWLNTNDDERRLALAPLLAALPTAEDSCHEDLDLLLGILEISDPASPSRVKVLEAGLTLAFWSGRRQVALSLAAAAVAAADAMAHGRPTVVAARAMLSASLVRERYAERDSARADLHAGLQMAQKLGNEPLIALYLAHLARHLLHEGQTAEADRTMARALPTLRAVSASEHLGLALTTAGAIALARDDVPRAEALFTEGTPDCYSAVVGLALCTARTQRTDQALRLMAAADDDDAPFWFFQAWRDELRDARSRIIKSLPRMRVTTALRAGRGLTPAQAIDTGPGDEGAEEAQHGAERLTPREWDVAQLVMKGLSNQQIAHRTSLSVRTVESHIRNIRTALGLRSRAHMAAWAARHSSEPLV